MAGEKTRLRVINKLYVMPDGTTKNNAHPGWAALRFELFGFEKNADDKPKVDRVVNVTRDQFHADSVDCMFGHGGMQKIGDEAAGLEAKAKAAGFVPDAKSGYAAFVEELINDMVDNLANGIWTERGEGGDGSANVTILLEATLAALGEAGQDNGDAVRAFLLNSFKDKATRDQTGAIPAVAKHKAKILADRAVERAKKAAAAAKGADGGGLGDLLKAMAPAEEPNAEEPKAAE